MGISGQGSWPDERDSGPARPPGNLAGAIAFSLNATALPTTKQQSYPRDATPRNVREA
jgi:hypothetical protein